MLVRPPYKAPRSAVLKKCQSNWRAMKRVSVPRKYKTLIICVFSANALRVAKMMVRIREPKTNAKIEKPMKTVVCAMVAKR